MITHELTEKVLDFARRQGAEMAGIAPVSRYDGAPEMLRPQSHMPEAKNVVVLAIHHLDASIDFGAEPNSNYPAGFQIGMIQKLDTMALRVAKFIESIGYKTVPYPCTYYWRHRSIPGVPYSHAASFSNINAFSAAGLGEYGWHGMAMSPKYGPRQRIVSIFTDAPLEGTPLYRGEALCDRCMQCAKACWGENYKKSALQDPATIRFEIEGKVFEYANINRWRCFWGEQCHLDMNHLAERHSLDEQGIYDAMDTGMVRSVNYGYMCSSLKFCMSKPVRKWDKTLADNPQRTKAKGELTVAQAEEIIRHYACRWGADRMAIFPIEAFREDGKNFQPDFRTEDFFKRFKYVVAIGRRNDSYTAVNSKLAAKNANCVGALNYGRFTIAALDFAGVLDDLGYSCIQDGGFNFAPRAVKMANWPAAPEIWTQIVITDAPLTPQVTALPWNSAKWDQEYEHIEAKGAASIASLPEQLAAPLRDLMPEAKTLLVTASAIPERVVALAGRQKARCGASYQMGIYQTIREAFWAASDIADDLTRSGHNALALGEIEPYSPSRWHPYAGMVPDIRAQAPFAAAAGLGFIGKNGILVSPKYGQRLRFSFVLTDCDITPSPSVSGKCPDKCTLCAAACPVQALKVGAAPFERNEFRCEWARVLDMSEGEGANLNGYRIPDLPVPDTLDDEARLAARRQKDPIQTRCYGGSEHGIVNGMMPIERCAQVCPFNTPQ